MNHRNRPNAEKRQKTTIVNQDTSDKLGIINYNKDLEWLAWNWRMMNNENEFNNRYHMVLENFNRSVPMLPSAD